MSWLSSRANNILYSPTVIEGSGSLYDPLLHYFQLKILAQTNGMKNISVNFFAHTKDAYGKFGWPEQKLCPCTWDMHEKARINLVKLENYFMNSI